MPPFFPCLNVGISGGTFLVNLLMRTSKVMLNKYGYLNFFYKVSDRQHLPSTCACPIHVGDLQPYPQIYSYYKFEDNNYVGDSETEDYGASANITTPPFLETSIGLCTEFPGFYFYLQSPKSTYQIGSSATATATQSTYTIDMWITTARDTNLGNAFNILQLVKGTGTADAQYCAELRLLEHNDNSHTLEWTVVGTSQGYGAYWNVDIADFLSPQHIAIVKTASGIPDLYIGGIKQTRMEYVGTTADNTKLSSVYNKILIGANISTYNYDVAFPNFAGTLRNLRINSGALWTANFTPPALNITNTTASNTTLFLALDSMPFYESVKKLNWVHPPLVYNTTDFNSDTKCCLHSAYSAYFPPGARSGLKCSPFNLGFATKTTTNTNNNLGFTIEVDVYLESLDSSYTSYVFFCGPSTGTVTSSKTVYITRTSSAIVYYALGSTYSYSTTATGRHQLSISYDASLYKVFFYYDRTCVASKNVGTSGYSGTDTPSDDYALYIGCAPNQQTSGLGGYLQGFRVYNKLCKYSSTDTLSRYISPAEATLLMYHNLNNVLSAIELNGTFYAVDSNRDLSTAAEVLRYRQQMGFNRMFFVRVPFNNNSSFDYWAPLVGVELSKINTCPYNSGVRIQGPPNESMVDSHEYMIGSIVVDQTAPHLMLDNNVATSLSGNGFFMFPTVPSSNNSGFNQAAGDECYIIGYSRDSVSGGSGFKKYYSTTKKFGSRSMDFYGEFVLMCKDAGDFNLSGNWTVEYFYYPSAALAILFPPQTIGVFLFQRIAILPNGLCWYPTETTASSQISSQAVTAGAWHFIRAHHQSGSNDVKYSIDGGSTITKTLPSQCFERVNDSIIINLGSEDNHFYVDGLRIRQANNTSVTVPTSIETAKTDYAFFNFEDAL